MNDIIYLESDSEITEAIDELKQSSGDMIKIVVPARSSLLQSVVNMKLLKKTADEAKKQLVLVTGDKSAAAVAGKVGLLVAATLKAEPKLISPQDEEAEEEPDIIEQTKSPQKQPVSKGDERQPAQSEGQSFTRKNIDEAESTKPKKAKKSKVPNYSKLQKRIFVGIGIALALILLVFAGIFLISAKVIIFAQADKKDLGFNFTLNSSISTSDYQSLDISAKKVETSKDLNANFNASGKKDVGTKASGNIPIKNCEDTNPHNLPAGSKLTASGKNFITNNAVTIPDGQFSGGGLVCTSSAVTVAVTAADNGDSYNLTNATFTIISMSTKISGVGSTSGGTSKQVTVVTQADIDNAKKQMIDQASSSAKDELMKKDNKNTKVFAETYASDVTNFKSSVEAGGEATSGSVSATVNYSMLSASVADLNLMFNKQIEADTQSEMEIYDNGYSAAQFKLIKLVSSGNAQIKANTVSYIGKKIDKDSLSKKLTNKPKKQVQDIVKDNVPDAKSVQVEGLPFSPNMPILAKNIKIEVRVNTEQ
ncbi:MAG: hypothetical protein Q8P54_00900 [bacterium]|nr:hypothetical protein [bacterium]